MLRWFMSLVVFIDSRLQDTGSSRITSTDCWDDVFSESGSQSGLAFHLDRKADGRRIKSRNREIVDTHFGLQSSWKSWMEIMDTHF